MAEYIKREDAMSHPFANGKYDHENANIDFILGHESYKEWLETLPAVDVRENVRGKLTRDRWGYRCTCCGAFFDERIEYFVSDDAIFNYCLNCGADMRGELK